MKFTIYGNPVKHSKSPQMHNAGFKYIDFNANYTKTLLEDGHFIKKHFLDNNINGANITVPYKEDAFEYANEVKGIAKEIGAVNTYINENGKIIAYNTDAPGFIKAIEDFGRIKSALILGAGGTAKAIAVALKNKNINTTIINRSEKKLEFFKHLKCKTYSWDELDYMAFPQHQLIINSTSAGLNDREYPISKNILEHILIRADYAFDCIYGKQTPFLQLAKKEDLKYKDGEDMLLYQGVLAFELFTGIKADIQVVEAMRKGLKYKI
ncbi:Shikimate 5-dehydrogenase I alpha [hydrothermal vent metagenome]|uniref:shikimate dehydrogenase (NADP(+)) n=1 Tax=hydrothermal vent metagenome TaxID=652676 RepID=A0A3B1E781_9ZZZZ